MITSGRGKEFVIGNTLTEAGPTGERGIHEGKILACLWVSFIVPADYDYTISSESEGSGRRDHRRRRHPVQRDGRCPCAVRRQGGHPRSQAGARSEGCR